MANPVQRSRRFLMTPDLKAAIIRVHARPIRRRIQLWKWPTQ